MEKHEQPPTPHDVRDQKWEWISSPEQVEISNQINGNNGSATNTDDHAAKNPGVKALVKAVVNEEKKHHPNQKKKQKKEKSNIGTVSTVPVSIAVVTGTKRAKIERLPNGNTLFTHSEFIGTLAPAGTSWSVGLSYNVNPGMVFPFPWLSTEAAGFEKYHFKFLRYRYIARCSSNTTGSVGIVPDYDAADPVFTNEADACQFSGMKEDNSWRPLTVNVDCTTMPKTGLFIRYGPLGANLDVKTYDMANVYVYSEGASGQLGKMWVDYSVELMKPQSTPAHIGANATMAAVSGVSQANPFGTVNNLVNGTIIASVVGQVINLTNMINGREYFISFLFVGSTLAMSAPSFSSSLTSATTSFYPNAAATGITGILTFYGGVSQNASITLALTGATVTNGTFVAGTLPSPAGF